MIWEEDMFQAAKNWEGRAWDLDGVSVCGVESCGTQTSGVERVSIREGVGCSS